MFSQWSQIFLCFLRNTNWLWLTDRVLLVNLQLPSEDPEIFEVSSKCLSMLVQLYGGENPDSLCPENAENFADVLTSKEDPKERKLLLKILRRMVSPHRNWGRGWWLQWHLMEDSGHFPGPDVSKRIPTYLSLRSPLVNVDHILPVYLHTYIYCFLNYW